MGGSRALLDMCPVWMVVSGDPLTDRGHIYKVQDNMESGSPSPNRKHIVFGSSLAIGTARTQFCRFRMSPNFRL
ncbi:unnamed protein product [Cuscuta campestris]|uniref:Uncharacterized protein n=1 Tax=Cuscuta campestris TaxID=132261 RepID=A0A484L8G7_9ASTE|nr:unnamed protein product [Cuscuta campestris]